MHSRTNSLSALAARAGRGEPGALAELRQQLDLHLPRIVHWALRAEDNDSVLARRIRAAVGSLAGSARDRAADPAPLIGPVARSICQGVVQRLEARAAPGPGMKDTLPG